MLQSWTRAACKAAGWFYAVRATCSMLPMSMELVLSLLSRVARNLMPASVALALDACRSTKPLGIRMHVELVTVTAPNAADQRPDSAGHRMRRIIPSPVPSRRHTEKHPQACRLVKPAGLRNISQQAGGAARRGALSATAHQEQCTQSIHMKTHRVRLWNCKAGRGAHLHHAEVAAGGGGERRRIAVAALEHAHRLLICVRPNHVLRVDLVPQPLHRANPHDPSRPGAAASWGCGSACVLTYGSHERFPSVVPWRPPSWRRQGLPTRNLPNKPQRRALIAALHGLQAPCCRWSLACSQGITKAVGGR